MPRLFTGIELPKDIVDNLEKIKQPLQGATWVNKENFHISLRFAGDIDNKLANEFAHELSRIDQEIFEIQRSEEHTSELQSH